MGLFSSSSRQSQTQEGDIIFNNAVTTNSLNSGGGGGSGGGTLRNFNVGRGNTLRDNTFNVNVTDGDAVRNALMAGASMQHSAAGAVEKGAAYAIGSNEAVTKKAIDAGTTGQIITAEMADSALDHVTKTTSEALKAAREAQAAMAAQSGRFADNLTSFANQSNNSIINLAGNSLDTYEDLVTRTGNQMAGTLAYAQNATGKAMDYMFESSKSENERVTGDVVKMAGWAVAGVAAMFVLSKWGA